MSANGRVFQYITDRQTDRQTEKFLVNKKSQSALEYMMTYGWAILIIVIVAAVLYSLGIFNPAASISATVTGFSGLGSVQAECLSDGALALSVGNSLGNYINITNINTTDSSGKATTTPFSIVLLPENSADLLIPSPACSTVSSDSVTMTVTYTEPGEAFPGPYYSTGTVKTASAPTATAFTQSVFPKFPGFSQDSNGQGIIQLPSNPSNLKLTSLSAFTVAAWVYPTENTTNQRQCNNPIMGTYYDYQNLDSGGFEFTIINGNLFLYIVNGTTDNNGWNPGLPVPLNQWSFVAATVSVSGGTASIGIYTNSQTYTNSWGPHVNVATGSTNNITVGFDNALYDCPGRYAKYAGEMGDVQVYNESLTSAQIQQLYGEGFVGTPLKGVGLAEWLPLAGNLRDYSGNNNNGVWYNPDAHFVT